MKNFSANFRAQLGLIVTLLILGEGTRLTPSVNHIPASLQNENRNGRGESSLNSTELETEMYPTGSTLPDCTHACGPCRPCRRVMVSYSCLMAESCPVVYRCRCRGRYYQVPSN